MPTKSWRKNIAVTDRLTETPYEFQFLQAIRLLERSVMFERKDSRHDIPCNPVARFTPPSSEILRISTNPSLAFPSAEIQSIERFHESSEASPWRMVVNIMGLTGSMGVLPYHYTELVLDRLKQKDNAMESFLDLFNHRILSLFFQASIKYNLPLQFERARLHQRRKDKRDPHTQALLSLIGMATDGLANRLYTKDESLVYYSGLFSQRVRTATGLRQILSSQFGIPVEIDQFIGQWQDLIDDVRSRLPDKANPQGRNVCLGRNTMLGKRGWYAQGKVHIILGPLDKQQLDRFAPGTHALKALNELARMYVGMDNEYDFIIRIKKREIPERTQLCKQSMPIVGWNAWLTSKTPYYDINETMDIAVSASRLGT
jgi:type VI secretion system protein ImpH